MVGALVAVLLALASGIAAAQAPEASSQPAPLLLIFDASGSMSRPAGNETRIVAARRVVTEFLAQVPDGTALGLTAYGHRRARDCRDIENLRAPTPADRAALAQLAQTVNAFPARGETPIAQTLIDSIEVFGGRPGRILLVTDGREECGGDVCAAARRLAAAGVDLSVDIIGFGTGPAERRALECITSLTGGRYLEARDARTLAEALRAASVPRTGLRVTVTDNGRRPDSAPIVRVVAEGGAERSQAGEDTVFDVPAGRYQVSARIGSGAETQAVPATVTEGRVTAVVVGGGTGRLAVRVIAAGQSTPIATTVELIRDGQVVAAEFGGELTFDTDPGDYTLRIQIMTADQVVEVPNLRVAAGQTNRQSIVAPVGVLRVAVQGGVAPLVQATSAGGAIIGVASNPAELLLLAGSYELVVQNQSTGAEIDRRTVTIAAGEAQTITITP
jgi:Ca-activated chloride channel family protein